MTQFVFETFDVPHLRNKSVGTCPLKEHGHAVRRFAFPGTNAHMVPATTNCPTPVTHHGFCVLELFCDRDRRVADAVALSPQQGVQLDQHGPHHVDRRWAVGIRIATDAPYRRV